MLVIREGRFEFGAVYFGPVQGYIAGVVVNTLLSN